VLSGVLRVHQPSSALHPAQAGLAARYREVRSATEALCAPLAVEDYVVQSMPDASPAKWHLAHTSWFFEEFVLGPHVPGYRVHDKSFRYLFNSYYEGVGPRHARPQRGVLSRPTVQQTFAYRAYVDEQMGRLLRAGPWSQKLEDLITLGLHHEQQHQELLLTDIKHMFSCNSLLPAYMDAVPLSREAAPRLSYIAFDGGLAEIGHRGTGFCFDNELPRHRVHVNPFRIANRAVTNGEFLEFVSSGGYSRPELWLSDGWVAVQQEQWTRPIYWADSLEQEFTLTGLRELNKAAPVSHLSYYEADAFARWAGARLPTEAEWEIAAAEIPVQGNFVEARNWHPVAAPVSGAAAPAQMFGDVWEWTQSPYSPYPGFRPAAGAVGEYNGKFMVNQLVLRGGSCATPRSHMRATYRNFFPPGARWQLSGLRLAMDT
jgi:ergothioneine biosynthesis protein EgtB